MSAASFLEQGTSWNLLVENLTRLVAESMMMERPPGKSITRTLLLFIISSTYLAPAKFRTTAGVIFTQTLYVPRAGASSAFGYFRYDLLPDTVLADPAIPDQLASCVAVFTFVFHLLTLSQCFQRYAQGHPRTLGLAS